jgi:hypothetical protein
MLVPLTLVELDRAAGRLAAGIVPVTAPVAPRFKAENDGFALDPFDTRARPLVEDGVTPPMVVPLAQMPT